MIRRAVAIGLALCLLKGIFACSSSNPENAADRQTDFEVPVFEIHYSGKTEPMASSEENMMITSKSFLEAASLIEAARVVARDAEFLEYTNRQHAQLRRETVQAVFTRSWSDEFATIAQYEFKDHHSAWNYGFDGRLTYRVRRDPSYDNAFDHKPRRELVFDGLRVAGYGNDWIIQGSFTSASQDGESWTGNLLAQNAAGEQMHLIGFTVELQPPRNTFQPWRGNYRGLLRLSGHGEVAFVTERAIPLPTYLESRRYWIIDGYGDANVEFEFADAKQQLYLLGGLHTAFVKMRADSGRRIGRHATWDDILAGQITSLGNLPFPYANPGGNLYDNSGEEVRLHGLFSRDTGKEYLTYQWRLVFKPTGSGVDVPDPNSPELRFTPDKPGTYIFGLTVSNGTSASESFVNVWVNPLVSERPLEPVTTMGQLEFLSPLGVGADISISAAVTTHFPPDAHGSSWGTGQGWDLLYSGVVENILFATEPGLAFVTYTDGLSDAYASTVLSIEGGPFEIGVEVEDPRGREAHLFAHEDYLGDGSKALLVVTHPDSFGEPRELVVYVGEGVDALQVKTSQEFVGEAQSLLVRDFNGNGRPDVAITLRQGFAVMYQLPDGTLSTPKYLEYSFDSYRSWEIRSAHAGDFNANGRQDLVALPDFDDQQMLVWPQTASGLASTPTVVNLEANARILRGGLGDVNGNGLLDIIASVPGAVSNKRVYFNDGEQGFLPGPGLASADDINVHAVWLGDIDRNGRTDIILLGLNAEMFMQTEGGLFQSRHLVPLNGGRAEPTGVLVADLNGNGNNDIVIKTWYRLVVGMHREEGEFWWSERSLHETPASTEAVVAAFDANQDGVLDLVLPASFSLKLGPTLYWALLGGVSNYAKPVDVPTN